MILDQVRNGVALRMAVAPSFGEPRLGAGGSGGACGAGPSGLPLRSMGAPGLMGTSSCVGGMQMAAVAEESAGACSGQAEAPASQQQAAQAQQQAAAAQQQNATPTGAPQMLVANASMMPEGAPPLPLSAAPPRLS